MTDSFNLVDATDETRGLANALTARYNTLLHSPGQNATIQDIVQLVGTSIRMLNNAQGAVQFKGYLDSLNQELAPLQRALDRHGAPNAHTAAIAGLLIADVRALYDSFET